MFICSRGVGRLYRAVTIDPPTSGSALERQAPDSPSPDPSPVPSSDPDPNPEPDPVLTPTLARNRSPMTRAGARSAASRP